MTERVTRTSGGTALGALTRADADIAQRVDQIQRDRCQAWLDHAAYTTGVSQDAILAALATRHDADAELTRELITETAAALTNSATLARTALPAEYVNGMRGRADARAVATDDDAFRASLASKLPAADVTTDASGRARTTDAVAPLATDDDAFRLSLVGKQ